MVTTPVLVSARILLCSETALLPVNLTRDVIFTERLDKGLIFMQCGVRWGLTGLWQYGSWPIGEMIG